MPAVPPASDPATVGLLLSGGLDSAILLGDLLRQGCSVQPLYVRSSLVWEEAEVAVAKGFVETVRSLSLPGTARELVVLDAPVSDLYRGHWSLTGIAPPDAETPDDAVYLPGRNLLLLTKTALWCHLHGIERLALGVLRSNPFADATPDFFDRFEALLNQALGSRLRIVRPFGEMTKRQVMELGKGLPLEHTFSCIAPVGRLHCGRCNKCAERRAAFRSASMNDPTAYADAAA